MGGSRGRDNPYAERSRIVRSLGFKEYENYLSSRLWRNIRQAVIRKSGGRCVRCKSADTLQVHHRRYTHQNLSGDSTDDMMALCRLCHHAAEFRPDGVKATLDEANAFLDSPFVGQVHRPERPVVPSVPQVLSPKQLTKAANRLLKNAARKKAKKSRRRLRAALTEAGVLPHPPKPAYVPPVSWRRNNFPALSQIA